MQDHRLRLSGLSFHAGMLCAALALAGCGGGDAGQQDQLASELATKDIKPGITKPAIPADKPARLDTAPFVQLAVNSPCTDQRNRMYVIDQTYVFWNSAGSCADASYSFKLYKLTADAPICTHGDSIAGPRTSCSGDDQQRALFESLIKNADVGNLGLDDTHTVEKVDLGVYPVAWTEIDKRTNSQLRKEQNLVIKDAGQWSALWSQHAPGEPLPKIDFSTKMVIAAFGPGGLNLCFDSAITGMSADRSMLLVLRTDTVPGDAPPDKPELVRVCAAAISAPAHIVAVDRVDVPVEFIVKQRIQ